MRSPRSTATKPDEYRFLASDFLPRIKTQLLILQPTPFCNIACDYCYLPNRNSSARMSMATVRQAAERLRDDGLAGAELTVVWHAGEPLVMPIAFYDEAIATVRDVFGASCKVSHSIQTNATLIDDAWCELFKRHAIRIGVSVDGPADLHDKHRRTRSGRGTHERVLRGMACLRDHDIGFHAIAVVTAGTFEQTDAFYDFFVEQGISELGCNFDEAEGLHAASSMASQEVNHDLFLARLIARSSGPASGLSIRELAIAERLIAQPLPSYTWRGQPFPLNAQTLPFALISVAHDGDFSCFSPELLGQPSAAFDNFTFGNVATGGYLERAQGARFTSVWNAIMRGTSNCQQSCSHFSFCGGGAPSNKFYENGDLDSGETLYCRTMYKRPFDAVLAHLEQQQKRRIKSAAMAPTA